MLKRGVKSLDNYFCSTLDFGWYVEQQLCIFNWITSNAWCKRMFRNHVFCPIVLYTNPSRAECFFTHWRCATFLSFDIKTIANMRGKPQHVGNVWADVPYMLRFSSYLCNAFYIKQQKRIATYVRETAQLESVYHTMGQNTWFQNMHLNQALHSTKSNWHITITFYESCSFCFSSQLLK